MTDNNKNTDSRQELRELSPDLYKVSRDNPFEVPPGYFEQLSQDVNTRIIEKANPKGILGIRSAFPRLIFVTATLLLLVVAGYFIINDSAEQVFNGYAEEMLYEEYFGWYADYQFIDMMDLLDDHQPDHFSNDQPLAQMSDDDMMMDYLMYYENYFLEDFLELPAID